MVLLKISDVLARVIVSPATWYTMIADGEAPQQKLISKRRVGWFESEINEFIQSRLTVE